MLRIVKEKFIPDGSPSGIPYIEAFVNSSFVGDFPTGVATGSKITEVDTGKVYLYDEDADNWEEQNTDGAGGAGYDAVIQLTETSSTTATGVVVKGDFATVFAKSQDGPVSLLVGLWCASENAEIVLTGSAWCGTYGDDIISYYGFAVKQGASFAIGLKVEFVWDADGIGVNTYEKQ